MKRIANIVRELIAIIPYSAIAVRAYKLFSPLLEVSIGSAVQMVGGVYVGPNVHIGDNVKIFRKACIIGGKGKTTIERDSFIGANVFVDGADDVSIGRHVAIAPAVQIFTHDSVAHWMSAGVAPIATGKISIGDNSYIGVGAIILKSVAIGKNSVVAAGAVVSASVPGGCVVIGSPAKVHLRTKDMLARQGVELVSAAHSDFKENAPKDCDEN